VHKLGVNHVVLLGFSAVAVRPGLGALLGALRAGLRTSGFVHRLGQFVARRFELRSRLVDAVHAAVGHRFLGFLDRLFYLPGVGVADLGAMFLEHLFDVVHHGVGPVARVDLFPLLAVFADMGFGILRHLLDFILAEARRRRDGDFLLVVGG